MYRERKRKDTSLNAMIFVDTRYFHFIKCKPDKYRGILLDLVFSNLSTNFHFTMNDSLLNYRLLFRQFPQWYPSSISTLSTFRHVRGSIEAERQNRGFVHHTQRGRNPWPWHRRVWFFERSNVDSATTDDENSCARVNHVSADIFIQRDRTDWAEWDGGGSAGRTA